MVKDRKKCSGCPHFIVVETINSRPGEYYCKFAIKPCDNCRSFADQLQNELKIK